MDLDSNLKQHIHFVGINGSGMSSVAHLMSHEGKIVTGSDKTLNGHDEKNITPHR